MWSPSSLIFLVLLGVWAAYFLQYWIRRRDHLATARSVEQFSEAMRVLERRDSTPRTDLSEPAPRSWNLHPGRATTRPQVLVKRAVPSEPVSPVLSERVDRTGEHAAPTRSERATRPPVPHRPEAPAAPAALRPRPGPQETRRVRPSRRVRALLMLVALAELVGIAVLVPLGYLEWWALAPAVVALVGSFAYVRAGVRAEQRLRAARRHRGTGHRPADTATRTERATRATASRPPAPARRAGEGESAPVVESVPVVESAPVASSDEPATSAPAAQDEQVVPERQVAEQPAAEAPVAQPSVPEEPEHIEYVHLVDEDDIPLTWEPVPVPRPTYTMKARAERPEVPPAEVTPDPAPVELPAEDGLPERRVAGA